MLIAEKPRDREDLLEIDDHCELLGANLGTLKAHLLVGAKRVKDFRM